MPFLEGVDERIREITGFIPTPEEQAQIDKDAERSAEVMFQDFSHPPMANFELLLGLSRELIAKHYNYSVKERRVGRTVLEFRNVDPLGPWEVGTKFLIIYAGQPRLMHQHEKLEDTERVMSEYITAFDSPSREKHCCDVELSTRCRGYIDRFRLRYRCEGEEDEGVLVPTIFYKTGQFVTIHRACEKCFGYLMAEEGPAKASRLRKLHWHIDTPPDLRSV